MWMRPGFRNLSIRSRVNTQQGESMQATHRDLLSVLGKGAYRFVVRCTSGSTPGKESIGFACGKIASILRRWIIKGILWVPLYGWFIYLHPETKRRSMFWLMANSRSIAPLTGHAGAASTVGRRVAGFPTGNVFRLAERASQLHDF